jgi:hypothetical protein
MKLWPVAAMAVALTAACSTQAYPRAGTDGPITVQATVLPTDPARPDVLRRGDFTYAGGLELKSSDTSRLGGLSDLKIDPQGKFISETDEGDVLRGQLTFDAAGQLSGMTDTALAGLRGMDGQRLPGKLAADAEGVAVWPNGDMMVSFERDHRIWVYPAAGGPPHAVPKPKIHMPDNQGMEGLSLAPHQGADAYWVGVEGGSIWLCHLASDCVRDETQVRPPLGYRLTALSETPAGDLIVLHNGWDPLRGFHIVAWITRPKPGQPLQIIAKLAVAKPAAVDNFEGVDTMTLPDGALRLFFISDDNFSAEQRSLLVAYDWRPKAKAR